MEDVIDEDLRFNALNLKYLTIALGLKWKNAYKSKVKIEFIALTLQDELTFPVKQRALASFIGKKLSTDYTSFKKDLITYHDVMQEKLRLALWDYYDQDDDKILNKKELTKLFFDISKEHEGQRWDDSQVMEATWRRVGAVSLEKFPLFYETVLTDGLQGFHDSICFEMKNRDVKCNQEKLTVLMKALKLDVSGNLFIDISITKKAIEDESFIDNWDVNKTFLLEFYGLTPKQVPLVTIQEEKHNDESVNAISGENHQSKEFNGGEEEAFFDNVNGDEEKEKDGNPDHEEECSNNNKEEAAESEKQQQQPQLPVMTQRQYLQLQQEIDDFNTNILNNVHKDGKGMIMAYVNIIFTAYDVNKDSLLDIKELTKLLTDFTKSVGHVVENMEEYVSQEMNEYYDDYLGDVMTFSAFNKFFSKKLRGLSAKRHEELGSDTGVIDAAGGAGAGLSDEDDDDDVDDDF